MRKSIYGREYDVVLRLLRETRQQAGITQVQLARRLKSTQSVISKYERGDRRLDVIQLRTICRALGTTLPAFASRLEDVLAHGR